MIQTFIDRFMDKKPELSTLLSKHPGSYGDIVKYVIESVTESDEYGDYNPDPERIHSIDDGSYQGTLLFVIGAKGYRPDDYWYVKVSYGSCSGCDTLENIRGYSDEPVNDEQLKDYLTLALHIVQGLKKMGDDDLASNQEA